MPVSEKNCEEGDRILTPDMSKYLEQLRKSGVTNMLGAAPYLSARFNLNQKDAQTALYEWIQSHD